ncbi:MAG: hypothetical protein V7L31_05090 [Nostoc sp.]
MSTQLQVLISVPTQVRYKIISQGVRAIHVDANASASPRVAASRRAHWCQLKLEIPSLSVGFHARPEINFRANSLSLLK